MSAHKLMNEIRLQAQQDKAMLESMARLLRTGSDFSLDPNDMFDHYDMADLLDRLREEHVDHLV